MDTEMRAELSEFDGRVVAISGAAGGMGGAVAARLLTLGARVSGCSRQSEFVGRYDHEHFHAFIGDLSRRTAADEWIQSAVDKWGHLDAVVNAVGLFEGGPLLEV